MKSCPSLPFFLTIAFFGTLALKGCQAFAPSSHSLSALTSSSFRPTITQLHSANKKQQGNNEGTEQYRNAATEFLSNFMQKKNDNDNVAAGTGAPVVGDIDFGAAKQPIADLETLAAVLDYELYQKEWFVTGNVNPVYFAESFRFQDPDVTLDGVDAYAKGVSTLFDQSISRAEIIQTVVNPQIGDNVITCTWRLSGRVNIGPGDGLTIKPYIVFTDFFVQDGLVVRQEDRFDLPQWDILLSSLFPFLIGKVTKPPAPPVEPREVPKPKIKINSGQSPLNLFGELFNLR